MYSFCTYFDRHYLTRGLALYRSLQRHCPRFELWILCLDEACHEALSRLQLSRAHVVSLAELERADPELAATRTTRSLIEYYFTCTPALPLYILREYPDVTAIAYLDADLFFFSDPAPMFEELGDGSIGIIAHRFSGHLRDRERYGIFNVGCVLFRSDRRAIVCLAWWRERCIEWCFDRLEDGRFADQKYLNDWPTRFSGVKVLRHVGINVAAWNLAGHEIRHTSEGVRIDGHPLVFFHFHGFRQLAPWVYEPNFAGYGLQVTSLARQVLIWPYILALRDASGEVAAAAGWRGKLGSMRTSETNAPRSLVERIRTRIDSTFRQCKVLLRALLRNQCVVAIGRYVL